MLPKLLWHTSHEHSHGSLLAFIDLRSFDLGGGVTLLLYLDSVDLRNEGSADAFLLLKIEKYIRSLTFTYTCFVFFYGRGHPIGV